MSAIKISRQRVCRQDFSMPELVCPGCGGGSPEHAKFCIECGGKLANLCPGCGSDNPPRARFCAECGTSLVALPTHAVITHAVITRDDTQALNAPLNSPDVPTFVAAASPLRSTLFASPLMPAAPAGVTERRQITVLFCDLVGSTALAEKLDPEDLHLLITSYQEACSTVIHRHDGYIAKYLGDGQMVFFGYPHAHEDAAHRALRAALEMVQVIKRLAERVQTQWGVVLAARIGVHTGLVVAGEMGAEDRRVMDIVGEAPNIAARLQEGAEAHTVVLSAATYRLTANAFTFRALGGRTLKGLSRPLEVYQALAEMDSAEESAGSRLTAAPLVGRAREQRHLGERWQQARAGQSQIVLLSGEAGIGKTRLLQELLLQAATEENTFVTLMKCSPYNQSSAFHPIIQVLQNDVLQFKREDTGGDRWHKLEAFLRERDFDVAEAAPLLGGLLALPPSQNAAPTSGLSAEGQRQKTIEILLRIVLRRAGRQPYLLVLENAHWADPSTIEFLRLLADRIQQEQAGSLLLMLTFRPLFEPPFMPHPSLLHLCLERLDDTHVRSIVHRLAGERALAPDMIAQIVAKTDGVPLYVEELTKMVLESGAAGERGSGWTPPAFASDLDVPTTLNDSLMARLDRLSSIKEVAQIAAAIGREFTCELLQAVCLQDENSLRADLDRLVAAELLHQTRDVDGGLVYRFKHALIQDAAYKSLLISRRQYYHRQIAEALNAQSPDVAEQQPELLAGHYTLAGLVEPALACWNRAGQRALARSANQEAIIHFSKSLELLQNHPDTPDAHRQELFAQASLSVALTATQGFASPNVGRVFARAQELCVMCGDAPETAPMLVGLTGYHLVSARFEDSHALAERLIHQGAARNHHAMQVIGLYSRGNPRLWQGDLEASRADLEAALKLYDVAHHADYTAIWSQDPGVSILCFLNLLLWHQGHADQALAHSEQSLRLAEQTGHLFSKAWALNCAALLAYWRRDSGEAARLGALSVAHATEQNFPFFLAGSQMYQGWAMFQQGRQAEGMEQMQAGLALYQAIGSRVCLPFLMGMVGEAQGDMGNTDEGLRVVQQGLDLAQETGEHISAPNLHRVKGSLLLKQPVPDAGAAQECFERAIELARDMGAKSSELQAATHLCRLLQSQDKPHEACNVLAPVHSWFTEGYDTPDYREAALLLAALN